MQQTDFSIFRNVVVMVTLYEAALCLPCDVKNVSIPMSVSWSAAWPNRPPQLSSLPPAIPPSCRPSV